MLPGHVLVSLDIAQRAFLKDQGSCCDFLHTILQQCSVLVSAAGKQDISLLFIPKQCCSFQTAAEPPVEQLSLVIKLNRASRSRRSSRKPRVGLTRGKLLFLESFCFLEQVPLNKLVSQPPRLKCYSYLIPIVGFPLVKRSCVYV